MGRLQRDGISANEVIYTVPDGGNSTEHTAMVGRKWLRKHNPGIDWTTNSLKIRRPDETMYRIWSQNYTRPKAVVHFKQISLNLILQLVRKLITSSLRYA